MHQNRFFGDPQLYLRGLLLRGRRGKGKRGWKGKGEGRERGGRGRGENHLTHPLSQIPGYATDVDCRPTL